MGIKYKQISRKPLIFLRLTGLKLEEFRKIVRDLSPEWESKVRANKRAVGRPRAMESFEDQVLSLFIYYRCYITHEFIGYLFNLHNSNICRLFKVLEPLLAVKVHIKKDRTLTAEKILELLIDVTEQPIQRPKKRKPVGKRAPKNKQKTFYSGKKKRHTIKKEFAITESGKIVGLSKSKPGRQHDFRVRKEGDRLPISVKTLVDSGYQGLQRIRSNVILPFKGTKKNPLSLEQKYYNTVLASKRIKVEHKIREYKIFKIMAESYRNFGKKHNLRSNIIAGVVNLKNGF